MKNAFVFPGQGSQSVGMLSAMGNEHAIVAETFAAASEQLGYDLWALVQHDENGRLSQTAVTQPALLTASVALWRVWQQSGGSQPVVMAGHSLGEYSALVCAGAMTLEDGVALVEARGRFMQEAVPAGEGAMAAILGLDDEVVVAACDAVRDGVVAAVNFNAPGQVVIAGAKDAVESAIENCKAGGARRALPLPVSVPSHCELMRPAAERLAARLADIAIAAPQIPVINNVDVVAASAPGDIRDALVRQLYSPVRWVETMRKVARDGAQQVIECGPGKVLGGLQKRIDKNIGTGSIESPDELAAALAV